jgi:hypothetical protein
MVGPIKVRVININKLKERLLNLGYGPVFETKRTSIKSCLMRIKVRKVCQKQPKRSSRSF